MKRDEILGIDLLRICSAFMVMIYHLAFWNVFSQWNDVAVILHGQAIGVYLSRFSYFGWVGVEVFFVISGCLITASAEHADAFRFFRSRFVRLMPAVWIASLVGAASLVYVTGAKFRPIVRMIYKSFVISPTGGWVDGSYWTLPIEVSFYCMVFFLLAFGAKRFIPVLGALIGVSSVVFWTIYGAVIVRLGLVSAQGMIDFVSAPWSLLLLIRHGCFFALGISFWRFYQARQAIWLAGMPILMACGCVEIYAVNHEREVETNIVMQPLIPIFIWIGSLFVLIASLIYRDIISRRLGILSTRIRFLGLLSYPLYLMHRPVALAAMKLFDSKHMPYAVSWTAGILVSILVACAITTVEPLLQNVTFSVITAARDTLAAKVRTQGLGR